MLSRHQFRNLRHSSFPSKRVGTPSDPFTLLSHACFRLSLQDRLRLAFDRALFQSEGLRFGVGGGGNLPYISTPDHNLGLGSHASRSSGTKTIHSTATLIPPATQARCRSEIKFHLEPRTISLIVFCLFVFFFLMLSRAKQNTILTKV